MPEYFELTFFSKKKNDEKMLNETFAQLFYIKDWKTVGMVDKFPLLYGKEFVFEIFDYLDFYEIIFSIPELVLTKKNFELKMGQLCRMVDLVLQNLNYIIFVTGIYELTSYYLQTKYNVKCLADITKEVLLNFPFLFFTPGNEYGFQSTFALDNVSCVINKDAQDIFANPIREIMEDECLSFDEASKKVK